VSSSEGRSNVVPIRPGGAQARPDGKSGEGAGELNLRILRSLFRYLADTLGAGVLDILAAKAGLSASDLDGRSRWVSLDEFETLIAEARARLPDDETFKAACVYKLPQLGFGPLRFVLWAASPSALYRLADRNIRLVSRIGQYEVRSEGRSFVHARYTSAGRESRLHCMVRQAQCVALPSLWGLPPAQLVEGSCIGRGDDACEYSVRWYESRRWLPPFVGLATGAVAVAALALWGLASVPTWVAFPLLGLALGYAYELRRTNRSNLAVGAAIHDALRQLAADESEARRETFALHERSREWTRLLEEQVGERTAALEAAVEQIRELSRSRSSALAEHSHDLAIPLTVLMTLIYQVRKGRVEEGDLQESEEHLDRLKRLFANFMRIALSGTVHLEPSRLEVAPLPEKLRRRLQALVFGREVRVSVFATREAPESIEVDHLLFDRVVDNLLTNAAKYTDRGSIVVELAGSPDALTLKISDTGRGIPDDAIERIFRAGGSDAASRAPGSHGRGLSVVVQLLSQIGGKLDVMSKPGTGTTFWAHFPHEMAKSREQTGRISAPDELVRTVVTIRKVAT